MCRRGGGKQRGHAAFRMVFRDASPSTTVVSGAEGYVKTYVFESLSEEGKEFGQMLKAYELL